MTHLTLDALGPDVSEASTRRLLSTYAVPELPRAEPVDLAWYEPGRCRVLRSWPLGGRLLGSRLPGGATSHAVH